MLDAAVQAIDDGRLARDAVVDGPAVRIGTDVKAHEHGLEQHLVAVGSAVERARADSVIGLLLSQQPTLRDALQMGIRYLSLINASLALKVGASATAVFKAYAVMVAAQP